jgi:hypothetical protein
MLSSLESSDFYRRARRGADNMYLRARSFFFPYLEERICFLHIAKCGGTAIRTAIERAQIYWKRWKRPEVRVGTHASAAAARRLDIPLHTFREQLLHYQLSRDDVPFVTGHFQLDQSLIETYQPKWHFVVVLRSPVQRWLSYYFFDRYKKTSDFNKLNVSLEKFLDSPEGRFRGQDYARLLVSDGDRHRTHSLDFPSEDTLERAKCTLDAFDVTGVLEDVPGFVDRFEERFGVRLKMGRERTSPASRSQREHQLSSGVREKIREICRPNIAVYEHLRDTLAG